MNESASNAPQSPLTRDVFCPGCGYDLRGSTGGHCTECGYDLSDMFGDVCRLPWVHRKSIGYIKAFWKTVWMVSVRNRRFCEECARPVSYADAQAFRWAVIAHVYLAVLVATLLLYWLFPPPGSLAQTSPQAAFFAGLSGGGPTWLERAYAAIWPVALLHICFLLYLLAATGVPSYFFHPRAATIRQQNNAIAMSYYTCGPIALLVVPMAMLALPALLPRRYEAIAGAGALIACCLPILIILAWWGDLMRVARRVLPQVSGRGALVGVCVPLLWLTLAGLILVGLPMIVFGVIVIVVSLL